MYEDAEGGRGEKKGRIDGDKPPKITFAWMEERGRALVVLLY
jgi:hypothetical protein